MTGLQKRLLRKACRYWGIQPDYMSAKNELVESSQEVLIQLLQSISHQSISTNRDLEGLIEKARHEKFDRIIEPVLLLSDKKKYLSLYVNSAWNLDFISFRITQEDGSVETFENQKRQCAVHPTKHNVSKVRWKPSAIPLGYHKLEIFYGTEKVADGLIIHAPSKLPLKPQKRWGLFVPLYGVVNDRNWGCGDLTDLGAIQRYVKKNDGSFVGTLPLMAADLNNLNPSPYSPTSRLFFNELYLDVESLLKNHPRLSFHLNDELLIEEVSYLRQTELVEHQKVANLKKRYLEILSEDFFKFQDDREAGFQSFLSQRPLVIEYAKFCAKDDQSLFKYHLYVQFQMHLELARLHEPSEDLADLYLDLPVGSDSGGFDLHKFGESFLKDFTAGAPPDLMFHGGQNWGFAPLSPKDLRNTGYRYFIEVLQSHLRYCRVLRIDHVMAFQRIYAIPKGGRGDNGAYIRFSREEFFAVIALEAHRFGAEIIGEDLGTVPDAIKTSLRQTHFRGMWVAPFEVQHDPKQDIKKAPETKIACLNTHDMVPFEGYCRGRDIEIFEELNLLSSEEAHQQKEQRLRTIKEWRKTLKLGSEKNLTATLLSSMAAGPCDLLLINIEDLWKETEPQNVPGTWREYPNWSKKLRYSIPQLQKSSKIKKLFRVINHRREEVSV